MTPRRSSGPPHPHSSGPRARPKGLKADVAGCTPVEALRSLAHEPIIAGQIDAMSPAEVARALAAIDDFNVLVGLPVLHPYLTPQIQREIERQRALRERPVPRSSPRR